MLGEALGQPGVGGRRPRVAPPVAWPLAGVTRVSRFAHAGHVPSSIRVSHSDTAAPPGVTTARRKREGGRSCEYSSSGRAARSAASWSGSWPEGHQVTGTSRAAGKAAFLRGLGAEPAALDVLDAAATRAVVAAARPDAVIYQATALAGRAWAATWTR